MKRAGEMQALFRAADYHKINVKSIYDLINIRKEGGVISRTPSNRN